ncbi:MAG: hypothetical protein GY927_19945 [bacterium]|nr:hypothetical protein [bacterium]
MAVWFGVLGIVLPACAIQSGAVLAQGLSWTHAFDFDGDGDNDVVEVEFTGGAHCCYRFAVHLTSTNKIHHLPFLVDGGYVGGLDLSRPERFAIHETDGTLPEMFMEIATYNGEPQPLPGEWTHRYGISTHHIAVGFARGQLRIRDWPLSK